jgi:tripartite-type tricarboxylate transporter receptor subunit TctC
MMAKRRNIRARRFSGPLGLTTTAVALAALAACSSSTSSASSAPSTGTSTASASAASQAGGPDTSFYNGKTITFVVANSPGSTADELTRAIVPGVESYLHATVKVEDISGNTSIGQNQAAGAKPDGLTVGILNVLTDANNVYAGTGALNFDLSKIDYVGATMQGVDLIVSCQGSSYKTWDQVVHSSQPVSIVNVTTGPADELQRLMVGAYQYKTKFINGYVPETQLQGCLRGDGNIAADSANNFETSTSNAMAPGLTPLLLTAAEPAASASAYLNKLVPTLAQYAAKNPPANAADAQALKEAISTFAGLGNVWFTPAGTPAGPRLALKAAIASAMAQKSTIQDFLDQGTPPNFVDPSKVVPFVENNLLGQSNVALVKKYLTLGG